MHKSPIPISISAVIARELAPVIFTTLSEIKDGKKNNCLINFQLRRNKIEEIRLILTQEVERYQLQLDSSSNFALTEKVLLDEIYSILDKGALNTICHGVDDYIRLKINYCPFRELSISTAYVRCDHINLVTGKKENKRIRYKNTSDSAKNKLLEKSMSLIEEILVEAHRKLKKNLSSGLPVIYSPEFYIYRHRLASNDSFECLLKNHDSYPHLVANPYELLGYEEIFSQVQNFLDVFVEKGTRVIRTGTTDYSCDLFIDPKHCHFLSSYHNSVTHEVLKQEKIN